MKNKLEEFLQSQGGSLDKETPDPAVLNRILQHMQKQHRSKSPKKIFRLQKLQWAAACSVLVVACTLLLWMQHKSPTIVASRQESRSPLLKKEDQRMDSLTIAAIDTGKIRKITRTSPLAGKGNMTGRKQAVSYRVQARTPELSKATMLTGLENDSSPAVRINAVKGAYTLHQLDNIVVDKLVATLNTDPSANVRLAVLDGLAQSDKSSYIRQKLVASLQLQQDPVVQIALINLLTGMGESAILTELDKLVKDENTMKGVKDCAYASIFRLRSS